MLSEDLLGQLVLDAIGVVGRASFGGGRTLSPPRRVQKISRVWGHRIIVGLRIPRRVPFCTS